MEKVNVINRGLAVLLSGIIALVLIRLLSWLFDIQDSALLMTIGAMLAAQLGFSAAERLFNAKTIN